MQINIKIFKERYYHGGTGLTYPGCTEEFCKPILEKYSKLKFNKDFYLGYSPERIDPGKSKKKLMILLKSPVDQILNLLK